MAAEEVGKRVATRTENGYHTTTRTVTASNTDPLSSSQSPPPNSKPNSSTQQSNSLPSTPHIGGKDMNRHLRTPSPVNGTIPTSSASRSAKSECDDTARPSGRTFSVGCPYETGIMNFKRRMPYSLGSDKLESSSTKVKKHLEVDEERKMTKEINDLYTKLQPTKESTERRAKFVRKLETLLNQRWPGSKITVHVFGSSGNSLFTNDSDVDICITTKTDALRRTCELARALGDYGMQDIECRSNAKVPIVKIWDPELNLACDMNINNTAALHNTKMMKAYVQMDPRVRPLAMVIKYWTRRRILNDAALGGTLSSYTWLCMIINFLQCRHPKILPSLQKPPYFEPKADDSTRFSGASELTKDFGKANREPLGDLLFFFFRRYAYEIDYERFVISVREGSIISKQEKRWHPGQNTRLCVEEPFNIDRNLGNTADDTSFRGVHLELRRAFDLISHGKLEECFAEYQFPPQEERISQNQHLFTRPTPQPRPVLTRSQSQTGSNRTPRASSDNKKTNQGGQKPKQGTSNRRASSVVTPHKLSNLPMPYVDITASGSQLHETLANQYQKLQRQEQQLRAKMQHQGTMSNQMYAVFPNANTYYLDPLSQGNGEMHRRHSNVSRSPQQVPMQQFTPLTNVPGIANFLPPGFLSNRVTSHQAQTNPPSPSLTHAQLGYRGSTRRSATIDSSHYTSARSHSQPPANNSALPQQGVYMHPDVYMATEWHGMMPGQRSLQDIQNDYLQNRQRRFANDDGTYSVHSADTQRFDSPFGGSELDSGSLRDERLSQDDSNFDLRYSNGGRSATLPQTMTAPYAEHPQDRVDREVSAAGNAFRSRPRASSSIASHGISFFADQAADSPEQHFVLPVRSNEWRDSGASFARRVRGDFEVRDACDTPEYRRSPEQFSEHPQMGLTYSSDVAIASGSSSTTPTREGLNPSMVDGLVEKSSSSKQIPASIQFGQFPARAPYRITHQPKPDDIRGNIISQGSGRGLYSHTLSGLGINMTNGTSAREGHLGNASGPANQSSTVAGLNLASTLKPGSILSPVREVRTPSPTAMRSSGLLMMSQNRRNNEAICSVINGVREPVVLPVTAASTSRVKAHSRARSVESARGQPQSQNQNGFPVGGRSENAQQRQDPAQVTQNDQPLEPSSQSPVRASTQANPVQSSTQSGPVPQQSQQNSIQYTTPSIPQQNSIQYTASSTPQQQQQQGAWQQSTTGRKRKNKKAASVGSISLPIDGEERKGG